MSLKKKFLVVLTALVSVVAIVAVSVMATVAYLTSSSAVSNVFTIGDVGIVFDEAAVDSNGEYITDATQRRDTNTYHLVPGKDYIKDPTLHVNATSVDSYVFVISRNDLAAAEETVGAKTMLQQAQDLGWRVFTPLTTANAPVTGRILVYCGGQHGTDEGNVKPNANVDAFSPAVPVLAGKSYKMFDYFQLKGDADVTLYSAAKITLSAYAIQVDGFGDIGSQGALDAAWDAIVKHFPIITKGNQSSQA